MSLIDSLDGMLMLFTYTWAYINPVRKLYYNLTITMISVVVAVLVALIEFFSLIGEQLELENGWWSFWYTLSDSFEWIGIVIVGAFILTWVVSAMVYRWLGYKALEREFDLKGASVVVDHDKTGTKTITVMEQGKQQEGISSPENELAIEYATPDEKPKSVPIAADTK
jgi:high-affinity nickel-transport protein